jgi:hypothetical protein
LVDLARTESARQNAPGNDVVRRNREFAQKMLTAKPDKDMQARVKKTLSDCNKGDKRRCSSAGSSGLAKFTLAKVLHQISHLDSVEVDLDAAVERERVIT